MNKKMSLPEAIRKLGVRRAAEVAAVARTTVYYWLQRPAPIWRATEAAKIIAAAMEECHEK